MSLSVDPTARNSEMQIVSSSTDVTPFAGSIVAYKTNSYYLGARQGFVLEDKSIRFGYIDKNVSEWCDGKKGYKMTKLLKPGESQGLCALLDQHLDPPILMRTASYDEITAISLAVFAGLAEFEYTFSFYKGEANTALEREFSKL